MGRGTDNKNNLSKRRPRWRYFRGHGIHSPFVYSLVRRVFMPKKITGTSSDLYKVLRTHNIDRRIAIQLQNLYDFGGYSGYSIDNNNACYTDNILYIYIDGILSEMPHLSEGSIREYGVCIVNGRDKMRREFCGIMADGHPGISIDKQRYFLYFHNEHYLKQFYRL